MFWRINYAVDDGYTISCRVCIIREVSKERALKVFNERIVSKFTGEKVVPSKYIEVTQCDTDAILYDGEC